MDYVELGESRAPPTAWYRRSTLQAVLGAAIFTSSLVMEHLPLILALQPAHLQPKSPANLAEFGDDGDDPFGSHSNNDPFGFDRPHHHHHHPFGSDSDPFGSDSDPFGSDSDVFRFTTTTNVPVDTNCLPSPHHFFPDESPAHSHYCMHNGSIFFEPVTGCLLPPPQPYWLTVVVSCVKAGGIYLLSHTTIKDNYSWFETNKTKFMAWATCGITVVSVLTLLLTVSKFTVPTLWEHYQCFGIVCADAPWATNLLLMAGSYLWIRGFKDNKNFSAKARDIYKTKGETILLALLATLFALMFFLAPFMVIDMYAVPSFSGNSIFISGFAPIMFGMILWFSLVVGMQDAERMEVESAERYMNIAPVAALPGALLVGLGIQFFAASLAYTATQQYPGFVSGENSLAVAQTERRSDIYFENLYNMVLTKGTWLVELINEVWP